MSQILYTLSAQVAQPIIKALEAAVRGLCRSSNHYDILATHTGAQTGRIFTQRHTLCKKDVLRVDLCTNHCEVIFRPSLNRAVLFLPYTAIVAVEHYRKVEPNTVSLYRAEQLKGQAYIYSSRGEYGSISA